MVDEKDEGDPKGDGEGDAQDETPEQKPDEANGDVTELKKQLASMKDIMEKQQSVIKKFEELGKESPPAKTDAERIQELESTLDLFKKKMEADAEAQARAEQAKREAAVNALIKEMPEFKDMRDTLMKVDEGVLTLFTKKQSGNTADPRVRVGIPTADKGEWQKKLAKASERRKARNETLQNIRY